MATYSIFGDQYYFADRRRRRADNLPSNIANSPRPVDTKPVAALVARHQALAYPYFCTFGGARLLIDDGVFCPTLTNASPLLLRAIDFRVNERVLDMFAGSGAFGLVAAINGSYAVAIDIDPQAVACARKNAAINGVVPKVDIRCGTLSSIHEGERFDLIIANPPLLSGETNGALGLALFDPGWHATLEFIRSLDSLLAQNGRCYLLTSDVMERHGIVISRILRANGLVGSIAREADMGYERYRVHRIVRKGRTRHHVQMRRRA